MNEQQRIFMTMAACMAIWMGWQLYVGPSDVPEGQVIERAVEPVAADSATPPPVALPVGAAPPAPQPQLEVHRSFETNLFAGSLRNGDGALTALSLLNYLERPKGEEAREPVSLVPHDSGVQAAIHWDLPDSAPLVLDFEGSQGLSLKGINAEGLEATLRVVPRDDSYALDYHLSIINRGNQPHRMGASLGLSLAPLPAEPSALTFLAPPADPLSALCEVEDTLTRQQASRLTERPYLAEHGARFAALDRQYFVAALIPSDGGSNPVDGRCALVAEGESLGARWGWPVRLLAPGESWEGHAVLYGGPKRDAELTAVDPALRQVINYNLWKIPLGALARPMMGALAQFHAWTGSWGVAIMLLTLSLKLLLFPVTYRSVLSMKRLQALRPEMDALKTRFADDRERQQMELLKLYRDRNVNPVGGCLPMLLQIPVWLTLYRTLWTAVDLYQQPFLWLPDLTAQEPIPLLGIAVGALTILQQRLTPMAVDNQQARIMMWVMPMMLTAFTVALPSGLVLYILVNSLLTILQQLAINSRSSAASP